jgi:cell division protein FtsB
MRNSAASVRMSSWRTTAQRAERRGLVRLARARRRRSRPHHRRAIRLAVLVTGRAVSVAAVLFVSATVGIQVWHVGSRNLALRAQIARVESDNRALADENARLAAEAQRMHNPEYLVPFIHQQLGLVKPNEVFIQVTPAGPSSALP